jgi:hypothetical protein
MVLVSKESDRAAGAQPRCGFQREPYLVGLGLARASEASPIGQ